MSFGQFIGTIGKAAGMGDAAAIAGYGLDAFSDYNARQDDKAMREALFRQQQEEMAFNRTAYLAQQEEQKALRDRLLIQSANLAESIKQVNEYLGVPYTPSQMEIVNDMQMLSSAYRDDIFRLAELDKSKKDAALMSRLGGADSQTMQDAISRQTVEKYAPELRKADIEARVNALKFATERMNLDQASRNNLIKSYGLPYETQFNMEQKLYNNRMTAPSESGTLNNMITAADNSLKASDDSYADSLNKLGTQIATTFGRKSDEEEKANSTIVGSGTRPSTNLYGQPLYYDDAGNLIGAGA